MARPNRLKELEKEHGDLNKVIPGLVNLKGQAGAAQILGVTQATISNWLREHRYTEIRRWVQQDQLQEQTA